MTATRARLVSFDGTESFDSELWTPVDQSALAACLGAAGPAIPRGAGLSYCNASAGDGVRTVASSAFSTIGDVDEECRTIVVGSGVTLGALLESIVPRGWYLPVMPGHPSITIGGCAGFNVHGKSPADLGCFIEWIEALDLFHPDHGEIRCSRGENPELFKLTVGGFGLTGFITRITLRLRPLAGTAIRVRRTFVPDLVAAIDVMEERRAGSNTVYSWNDLNRRGSGFGAGIVYSENIVPGKEWHDRPYNVLTPQGRPWPGKGFYPRFAGRLMCALYLRLERMKATDKIIDLKRGAFPINGKEIYFRLFGRTGLREYQMIIPRTRWAETVPILRRLLHDSGLPVTLGSLKLFDGAVEYLHFCASGVCLALDVPARSASRPLFGQLDDLVADAGGIANLSKDSRIGADAVRRMFPGYDGFRADLLAFDPNRRFDSALRRRLDV